MTPLPSLEQQADAILEHHDGVATDAAVQAMRRAIDVWLEARAGAVAAGIEATERDARRVLFEAQDRARLGRSTG